MNVSRELAFFGGWVERTLHAGNNAWGSPHVRIQECEATGTEALVLPPDTIWRQRGVPYWVFNSGAASLPVKRISDLATVWTVGPGAYAIFVLGSADNWVAMPNDFTIGPVQPALRLTVDVNANVANLNVLQRAIALGYDGTQPAAVTCRIRAGVAVGSTSNTLRSLTTGNTFGGVSWASGSYALLIVEPDAIVGGWGGNGGRGGIPGTGSAGGFPGQAGGQAVRAEIPLRIQCFGSIFGGGGGGGGGDSSLSNAAIRGGGGGGGRGANMTSTGALIGSQPGGSTPPAGGGTGGAAFSAGGGGLGVSTGGNAGNGGGAASVGLAGNAVGNLTNSASGLGGAAAAAISYLAAAGAPTILSGSGFILGATVSEAS